MTPVPAGTAGPARPRVALIYPPFGPPNLPSLGLGILSAGAKQRGYECRTISWHYRFAAALPLPGLTMAQKLKVYEFFTRRELFPWNEWIFHRSITPGRVRHLDTDALARIAALDEQLEPLKARELTGGVPMSQLVLDLCNNGARIVAAMAEDLAGFDVVGIGSTFFQNGAALALAAYLKSRWPAKTTVLGGANTDGEMGRAILELYPAVDYVFSGEVDHSFPEFLDRLWQAKPVADIPGIIYRDSAGQVVEGPRAEPVADMNSLPVPDFDDYVAERKQFGLHDEEVGLCLPLESSRGCWWGAKAHCTFCGLNANGMAYRQKDYARFQEEVLATVERYGTRYLFMADNILSVKYYKEFVAWAKEKQLGVDFFYEIKANVTRQQVRDLADAGITMVQPGIESFSSSVLALMRKGLRGIQNIAFLKYAADYGLLTAYNLLAGFPGEDPYEYDRMSDQLPKLFHLAPPNGLADIEFHRFSPYHNRPDAFGISLRPIEKYRFLYPFDEATVARLAYVFEVRGRTRNDLSYLQRINRTVMTWRNLAPGPYSLTWTRSGEDIVVEDRRAGFTPRTYRIGGYATAVYGMLDEPRPLRAVARSATPLVRLESPAKSEVTARPALPATPATIPTEISFTEAEFTADPDRCVQPLVQSGILYEEDGWYLTLPVMAGRRGRQAGWGKLGI